MTFNLYDCDVGIKYNGVSYDFTHVQSVTFEDPRSNKLTRGSNAGNKVGLVYREGIKDPDTVTIPIMAMDKALKEVLDQVHASQDRIDVYVISRKDGSSKMAKDSVLCQKPQQLTLDDTAESMDVSLMFESFNVEEDHKS